MIDENRMNPDYARMLLMMILQQTGPIRVPDVALVDFDREVVLVVEYDQQRRETIYRVETPDPRSVHVLGLDQ